MVYKRPRLIEKRSSVKVACFFVVLCFFIEAQNSNKKRENAVDISTGWRAAKSPEAIF
jgi:hypothetical protein